MNLATGVLSVSAAIVLLACDSTSRGSRDFVAQDSAGVRILVSHRPAWESGQPWLISDQPVLSIGTVSGPESMSLHRVGSVLRLSDGRIVVANGGSHELRYYEAGGKHLHSVGGIGSGPGEFQAFGLLLRFPGDSVAAFDGLAGRLTVFDENGRLAATHPVSVPPSIFGRFQDGTFVYSVYRNTADASATSGYVKPALVVVRSGLDGSGTDTIGELGGNGQYRVLDGGRVFTFLAPFAPAEVAAVARDRFYIVSGHSHEITQHSQTGEVEALIRIPLPVERLTTADIDEYKRTALRSYAVSSDRRRLLERVLADATYPESVPTYSDLKVDTEGNLWVQLFTASADKPRMWRVFDAEGRWLGELMLPAKFEVRDIGNDYVLGVWTDELGVEHVQMYALEKGERRPNA